jgi:hypothetical protein
MGCGVEGCEGFIVCLQKEACAWAMLSWAAPEGFGRRSGGVEGAEEDHLPCFGFPQRLKPG